MISNVIFIVKIVLINGATNATPERSFDKKTWILSCVKWKRFNMLAILHTHKNKVENYHYGKLTTIL